jgi:archaemetzincin
MYVINIGGVEEALVQDVAALIQQTFGMETVVRASEIRIEDAWDAKRRQYNSSELLRQVFTRRPCGSLRTIALTRCDLFIPMLSFVYGQAQLGGAAAIVSVARLEQEFYGLPADRQLLRERTRKEVLHELGHTFELIHCPDRICAMSLSTNINQLDLKAPKYCEACRALIADGIEQAISAPLGPRPLAENKQ